MILKKSGYRQIPHTADLALEIWAPSQEKLLTTGARAIVELLCDDADLDFRSSHEVSVSGVDAEDRFVRWLNEVLSLALTEGFLFAAGRVELSDPGMVHGRVIGTEHGEHHIKTELKGVTYHDLELTQEPHGGWRARVVIDV